MAVLVNRENDDAGQLAAKLAAIAMGEPYGGEVVPLDNAEHYGADERYSTTEEKNLFAQRKGGEKYALHHLGQDRFIYADDLTTLTFHRTAGRLLGARLLTRRGEEELTRTDKPLPASHKEIKLTHAALQPYVGTYELMPGVTLSFRSDGDRFFLQPPGDEEVEVFGEEQHRFFLKVVDATIVFHPETDGTVDRITYTQGEAMEGTRIK